MGIQRQEPIGGSILAMPPVLAVPSNSKSVPSSRCWKLFFEFDD
jgi:hypothetical protein